MIAEKIYRYINTVIHIEFVVYSGRNTNQKADK